jgi:hypothetical protein
MRELALLLPTADEVLRLSTRQLGGYLLEAFNADAVDIKQHPKNIRNVIVDRWYRGSQADHVVAHVIGALDLLMTGTATSTVASPPGVARQCISG